VAREWRRLLVEPARLAAGAEADQTLALAAAESHYLRRVLRLRPGDRFAVIDGCGGLWGARLQGPDQARLEQPLAAPLEREPAPAPLLELLVAPPRRDADVLLRMACELGMDQLTLVQAERRVAGSLALERAEAIVREACEQSERLWLPQLALDQELAAELDRGPAIEARCRGELRLLATTRHANLEALQQVLASTGPDSAAAPSRVRLAIGPEGGWSAAEEQLALSRGWQPVSLGPTILRTSTAAVAAAAQLTAWRAGLAG
jgi:16S rRNA (uracil1498-N3)-methyltransferase